MLLGGAGILLAGWLIGATGIGGVLVVPVLNQLQSVALPEAIGMLRATRRQPTADQRVSVSGADPLNLVGILTPGPKLPAPWPATGCCTATVFRRPCWPRITFSFLNLSTLRASGPRRKRC